jgi:peroxiredoxin
MRRPVGSCGRITTLICFLVAAPAAPQQPTPTTPPDGSKSATESSSLLGKDAPAFVVKTLDGKQVSLADYKGKAVVVNFWATWCEACRQEMPWLAELREKYRPKGFEVLGIVTDRAAPEKIAAAVESHSVKYPILFCNHATAQAYGGLPELPVSFFIDRRGKIVAEMTGADSKEEIETRIKQALARQ